MKNIILTASIVSNLFLAVFMFAFVNWPHPQQDALTQLDTYKFSKR